MVKGLRGEDLRRLGSGNVGALNTYHQAGLPAALLVLLVDAAKGALAVLGPSWLGLPAWMGLLTACMVVAGHNWPVALGFRGGKGVASILGISLAVLPALSLLSLVPAAVVTALTRNVVAGVTAGFVVFNGLVVATGQDAAQVVLCLFLTGLAGFTYAAAARGQIRAALRRRSLRGLLYGENWNP